VLRWTRPVAAGLFAILLVGCGGPGPRTSRVEACEVFTRADATKIFGAPIVGEAPPSGLIPDETNPIASYRAKQMATTACYYKRESGTGRLQLLANTPLTDNGVDMVRKTHEHVRPKNPQKIDGYGDEAFFSKGTLSIYVSGVGLLIRGDLGTGPTLATARKIADIAVPRVKIAD
jgi:hypothetical protein